LTRSSASKRSLLLDACVLIDFLHADRRVLNRIKQHVGQISVTTNVLEEVCEIEGEEELATLGVTVVDPPFEDVAAAVPLVGRLSLSDWLCVMTAKRRGRICVTNDKSLRAVCRQHEVQVMWGLELLLKLHRSGGISAKRAVSLAGRIRAENPLHITKALVARFASAVEAERRGRI